MVQGNVFERFVGPIKPVMRKWNEVQEREGAAVDGGRGEEGECRGALKEQGTEGKKGYEVGRAVKVSWEEWAVMANEREGEIFNVHEGCLWAKFVH